MTDIKKAFYRHYKGNVYKVIDFAIHSETMEELVIYQDVMNADKIWARPASMWNEMVNLNGRQVRRFQLIEE